MDLIQLLLVPPAPILPIDTRLHLLLVIQKPRPHVWSAACWPTLNSLNRSLRSPEKLLAIVLTHCYGLRFHMLEVHVVSTHYAFVRRNRSHFNEGERIDLTSEMRMLHSLAAGKGHCYYCLTAQRQATHELTAARRIETSLVLSREGVHVISDGGRVIAWQCRTPPQLRLDQCASSTPGEYKQVSRAACCEMVHRMHGQRNYSTASRKQQTKRGLQLPRSGADVRIRARNRHGGEHVTAVVYDARHKL